MNISSSKAQSQKFVLRNDRKTRHQIKEKSTIKCYFIEKFNKILFKKVNNIQVLKIENLNYISHLFRIPISKQDVCLQKETLKIELTNGPVNHYIRINNAKNIYLQTFLFLHYLAHT